MTLREVSPQLLVYRGPVRAPGAREQAKLSTQELTFYVSITSTAGGLINNVIGNVNTAASDWTAFAGIFDEYRVLATTMIYQPAQNATYVSTYLGSTIVYAWDRDTPNALTGYAAGFNYESSVVSNMGTRQDLVLKMTGAEDAGFINISSPTPTWWLKMYSSGLTVSTFYGGLFIRYLIQFRSRV